MIQKKYLLIFFSLIAISLVSIASAQSEALVPSWIKNTAGFWSNNQISDSEFLNAIKYLLENDIIILKSDESVDLPVVEPVTPNPITKPRLNYCIILHSTYKDLGQIKFVSKYSHVNYIHDCVKLYKDPFWTYKGDDRIDKLYEKFLEFRQETKQVPKSPTEPTVTIQSSTKTGTEKYFIKFNICAGDLALDKAKVLIKSEIESVEVGSTKNIPANACRTYETQLYAKHIDNIKISIVEQVLIE